jgi:hypothetical protein
VISFQSDLNSQKVRHVPSEKTKRESNALAPTATKGNSSPVSSTEDRNGTDDVEHVILRYFKALFCPEDEGRLSFQTKYIVSRALLLSIIHGITFQYVSYSFGSCFAYFIKLECPTCPDNSTGQSERPRASAITNRRPAIMRARLAPRSRSRHAGAADPAGRGRTRGAAPRKCLSSHQGERPCRCYRMRKLLLKFHLLSESLRRGWRSPWGSRYNPYGNCTPARGWARPIWG